MTRTIPLFVGTAFAAVVALPAWGQPNQGAAPNAAEAVGSAVKHGTEAAGHAVKEGARATEEAPSPYEARERGEHRMSGTITAINHETGVLDLRTREATLQLHYPPKSIHELKKGQRLTVDLAYAKIGNEGGSAPAPASAPKSEEAEREHARHEMGEHWMTGEVTKVDAKTGVIDVKTAEAPLILHFPPSSIKDLKAGDHIAVELGFETGKRAKKEASAKNYLAGLHARRT
jgi:hypothetical protein